jgi:hypothetical protein
VALLANRKLFVPLTVDDLLVYDSHLVVCPQNSLGLFHDSEGRRYFRDELCSFVKERDFFHRVAHLIIILLIGDIELRLSKFLNSLVYYVNEVSKLRLIDSSLLKLIQALSKGEADEKSIRNFLDLDSLPNRASRQHGDMEVNYTKQVASLVKQKPSNNSGEPNNGRESVVLISKQYKNQANLSSLQQNKDFPTQNNPQPKEKQLAQKKPQETPTRHKHENSYFESQISKNSKMSQYSRQTKPPERHPNKNYSSRANIGEAPKSTPFKKTTQKPAVPAKSIFTQMDTDRALDESTILNRNEFPETSNPQINYQFYDTNKSLKDQLQQALQGSEILDRGLTAEKNEKTYESEATYPHHSEMLQRAQFPKKKETHNKQQVQQSRPRTEQTNNNSRASRYGSEMSSWGIYH